VLTTNRRRVEIEKFAMNPDVETSEPAINHDELIQRMMGSAQMAERMLDKFVDASATDCDDLESLVRLGNTNDIASLAHRLKGTAQTMAAPRVADVASEIETRAASDPTSELLDLVDKLRETHDEIRKSVETEQTNVNADSEQS
jgi:HPt (histidine-containing phosphotransfer) domain-containing protein